jgi:hypothetical protein
VLVTSARPVVAFALCLCGALALRASAYGLPLDRDAAVYQVIGRGLRDGALPYVDLIDHKQPLIYPLYALIDLVAPGSFAAPRVVSALAGAVAAALVFALLRGGARGATGAALVVILGASRFVQGFDLNTEHLLLVTGTLPIFVALTWPRAAFVVGLLCGVAVLTKAVALLLIPAALVPLARRKWFAAGLAVPLLAVALVYAGHLGDLWEWNVAYNADYASQLGVGDRIERLSGPGAVLLLIAVSVGAAVVVLRARRDTLTITLAVWLAGAVLGALAGGFAYAHYFVPIIVPAAALLALALPDRTAMPIAVAALGVLALAVTNRSLADRTYGGNVAVWEATEPVGAAIRERARSGDAMYVAGNEAGFYWQARVEPASRLLYDSILALRPELTPDLCARPPRFLVLPAGTFPEYATCLQDAGYTPLEAPPPVVALVR